MANISDKSKKDYSVDILDDLVVSRQRDCNGNLQCPICGGFFTPTNNRQKYCTSCSGGTKQARRSRKKMAGNLRRNIFAAGDLEQATHVSDKFAMPVGSKRPVDPFPEGKSIERVCANGLCGQKFHPHNPRQIYCHKGCRANNPEVKAAEKMRAKSRAAAAAMPQGDDLVTKVCIVCHQTFLCQLDGPPICGKSCFDKYLSATKTPSTTAVKNALHDLTGR